MKRLILVLFVMIGCSKKESNVTSDPNIVAVENSLTPNVYFEGDSLWNIEERMKFHGIPGASIAVINDNKIVWTKAYGIMDRDTKEPVTTTTLFQAASISKPVTGYAVLKTVESGKIDLTDDVNTWLKSWKLPDNEFTKDRKVNVADLLSHTGGISIHGFAGYRPDVQAPSLVQVLDGSGPANSDPIRVYKAPGGDFSYSGGGYTIMQQMMIDVYGKPFPEIENELVLGPLDMTNSSFDQPLDEERIKRAATGYVPNGDETGGKRHTYPELAAAGLWTTPEDLAKFAIDIQKTLKGESSKVISKETAEKMLTTVNGGMGLSMGVSDLKGNIYFGHSGWNEGFSSQMLASRDDGYGVVVMINKNTPQFITEVIHAVGKAYGWKEIPPTYKKMAMDTSVFRNIVGRYRNGTDGRITISSEGDRLFFKYIRAENKQELFRISDSTYVSQDDNSPILFRGNELVLRGESHAKVTDEKEFIPYEYLLAGDYKNALKGYQSLKKTNPSDGAVNKEGMEQDAEQLTQNHKATEAGELRKIIKALYP